MGQVIKRGGKKQAFSPKKIRDSVIGAAKEARLSPTKIKMLVDEVAGGVTDYYKNKRSVRSVVLRRSVLGRLDRRVKSAANAWRRFEKREKK